MEADDLICIDLYHDWFIYKDETTIACTRDKDLRMCPGMHYGWKCGKQEQFGPIFVDELGHLELSQGSPKKLKGTGLKFFYAQLITGDVVDNIPGLPKRGPAFAYKLLSECRSEVECFKAVKQAYEEVFGEVWENALREQTDLLWMIREINNDGTLKFYEWPIGGELSVDLAEKTPEMVESGQKQSLAAS
jgi:5'-3' exonuclease